VTERRRRPNPRRRTPTLIPAATRSRWSRVTNDVGMVTPPIAPDRQGRSPPAGAPCDVDVQCDGAAGLTCVCAPRSGCAAAFIRGICSMTCDGSACGSGAVCASIVTGPQPDAGRARPCASPPVRRTRSARPASSARRYRRFHRRGPVDTGLLAGRPGARSRRVVPRCDEILRDDACASGLCADVGALGVCSAAATPRRVRPDRPARVLADARHLCLQTCVSDGDCASDPLLACVALPASGDASIASGVCAPRPLRQRQRVPDPGAAAAWPRTASAYEKAADARALRRRLSPRTVGEVVLRRGASASAVVEVTAAHTPNASGYTLRPASLPRTNAHRREIADFGPKERAARGRSGWHAGCNDLRAIAAGNLKFGAHGAWRRGGEGNRGGVEGAMA
jgi:hypothetical protein